MRKGFWWLVVAALLPFWAGTARADGALAISPGQISQFSITYNEDAASADAKALFRCGSHCTIVQRFSKQCLAYAIDTNSNVYGMGWSVSEEVAASLALTQCQGYPVTNIYCRVIVRVCDSGVLYQSGYSNAIFDGHWFSPEWNYSYILRNGVGTATASNSPRFQPGDIIIRIQANGPNTFTGMQIYRNGRWYHITGALHADGRIYIHGDKNVFWYMIRTN